MKLNFKEIPSSCFLLIENDLIKNLKLIEKVRIEAGVEIICALKGFSMWSTFSLLKKYLSGATASSLHEAILINEEMGNKAHTYCPVYLPKDFEELIGLSSHLTFNTLTEFERYKDKIKNHQDKLSVGIRINPQYSEIKTDLYNPAIPLSRLGETIDRFDEKLPEGIDGLHMHVLCEQDSHVLERVLTKAEERFSHLFKQCRWINLGGGHLITHKDYDVNHLIELLKSFKSRYPQAEIILEPGEAIGWETGYLVSTVLDIIDKGEVKIAMLDVSFSAHMPDTLEMPYKPKVLGSVDKGNYEYVFGGMTCLAGDYMGNYFFENPLKIGDRIVFDDMIHYTMVKTTFFNGVQHPSIAKIDQNGNFEMVKTFEYKEFKSKLS